MGLCIWQGCIYLSTICFQETLRIHYDDLGLYKELLHFIEAKTWKVNELVILTIHLAKVTKGVIEGWFTTNSYKSGMW
jgi:hypothetical protein